MHPEISHTFIECTLRSLIHVVRRYGPSVLAPSHHVIGCTLGALELSAPSLNTHLAHSHHSHHVIGCTLKALELSAPSLNTNLAHPHHSHHVIGCTLGACRRCSCPALGALGQRYYLHPAYCMTENNDHMIHARQRESGCTCICACMGSGTNCTLSFVTQRMLVHACFRMFVHAFQNACACLLHHL